MTSRSQRFTFNIEEINYSQVLQPTRDVSISSAAQKTDPKDFSEMQLYPQAS